uniref:Uncharacterized protein n=1 Tax=Neogobius melanostomus TaxID=47308 RepID=A0A8C6WP79_9GOBI
IFKSISLKMGAETKYAQSQKDVSKTMSARQKLETQLTENNIVKEELDMMGSTNTVYKLIGPVLVKQELDEAKATVSTFFRWRTMASDLEVLILIPAASHSAANRPSARWRS